MDRATLLKRDRLILEASASLLSLRPRSPPTAKEIDNEVRRLDPALHGKWVGGQGLPGRKAAILRILREERLPNETTSKPRRLKPRPRRRSRVNRFPIWFVGVNQRDDLLPNYDPVAAEHQGSFKLQLLNRGRVPVADVEVHIGSTFQCRISRIEPGERSDLPLATGDSSFARYSDLLGGSSELSGFERYREGPGKEYRHLTSVRFTDNGIRRRELMGELRGSAKRYFYLFRPDHGRATPIF